MTCCSIAVDPGEFDMASQETLPLTFDATSLLLPGESITQPTSQLVRIDTGLDYAAGRPGGVLVTGTTLTQVVTGLAPRRAYRLIIQFQVATEKVWAPYLIINCPE